MGGRVSPWEEGGDLSPGMDATGGTGWERQGAGHEEGATDAERPPRRGPSLLVPESDHSGGWPGGLDLAGGCDDSDTGRSASWWG